VGNHDQFTDVSLFPTAVGDAQLPPGMLREKHSGLDKSLMGLEMRGGGGGSTTHHHENDYDDAWIRTWTGDAEGREEDYIKRLADLEGIDKEFGQSLSDADWERRLLDEQQKALGTTQQDLSQRVGDFETRFADQEAAFQFGLEGLQAATTGIDQRLAGQSDQLSEQLRLAQQGWANELGAAEAGWDLERQAWQQEQADWTNQFSQQQRSIETQLATEQQEYQDQLKSIQDIYGVQTQQQRDEWEVQAADQRQLFSDQLSQGMSNLSTDISGLDASSAAARQALTDDWTQRFAQSQEQQRIADAIQDRDFEAQLSTLGNQFQADWAAGSQAMQSEYQQLIQQASTDAEKARVQQAMDFERMQQDQSAAYNQKSQELAAQDRVFGTQIDELRRDLGIETDLRGQAQRDFAEQSRLLEQHGQSERSRLEQSIQGLGQEGAAARQGLSTDITSLGQESEAARQQLASGLSADITSLGTELTGQQQALQQDVTGQLGGIREDVSDYKQSLAEQKEAQDQYYAANKRFREMQIQDAERARTAASYGSPGTTLNQQVKGVRRAGSSQGLKKSKSPRNVFNRSGLRISSLNI